MKIINHLMGVYAAAVTPLRTNGRLDHEGLVKLLDFLAQRGAHGALLMGTTGEGTSFSTREKKMVFRAALAVRESHPEFKLLAGTGSPALEETFLLTRSAFDLGLDGVVVLPPYFFKKVEDAGLYRWYATIIKKSVPNDGVFLGYHIPGISGIGLSLDLIARLKDTFPFQFAGLKDSSGSLEQAQALGARFGQELLVFNGTDRLFSDALESKAAGCITAMANLISDELRQVWDAHQTGRSAPAVQASVNTARAIWEKYPPAASLIKLLLSFEYDFPLWQVKPPLLPLPAETAERALLAWRTRGQVAG